MNDIHEKSLSAAISCLNNMSDTEFFELYKSVEQNIGPTIDMVVQQKILLHNMLILILPPDSFKLTSTDSLHYRRSATHGLTEPFNMSLYSEEIFDTKCKSTRTINTQYQYLGRCILHHIGKDIYAPADFDHGGDKIIMEKKHKNQLNDHKKPADTKLHKSRY